MPNAVEAMRLIEAMRATNARTEKEALLKELVATEFGQDVVKWAYDPFITFGITPEKITGEGPAIFTFGVAITKLLEGLSERRLTGNTAKDMVNSVLGTLRPVDSELLFLVLSRDLKCGIAETSINYVMPGLLPVFSVMRAHAYEEKRIKAFPVAVEPKLDGFRYTFLCREGQGGFFTRSGKRAPAVDHLVEPMIELARTVASNSTNPAMNAIFPGGGLRSDLNFMVDGEMMAGSFNETSGALRRESEQAKDAKFHIFDLMSYADFDAVGSVGLPYIERRKLVEEFTSFADDLPFAPTEVDWCNSHEEIIEVYNRHRAAGREGGMVKVPSGLYDKKKSHNWLKLKAEETEDLRIVGVFTGKEHTRLEDTIGGFIVDRQGVPVRVSGISDAVRAEMLELWKQDAAYLGVDWKVGYKPGYVTSPLMSTMGFKLLGRLYEVEFHEVTPDGSLRHPRGVRFRDDKDGELETKEAA